MRSNTYKLEIGDVRLSVILNSASFLEERNSGFTNAVEKNKMTHGHSTYEIMAVTHGELVVNTANDTRVYKDEIVVIPPQMIHCCTFNKVSAVIFNFTVEKLQNKGERIFDVVQEAMSNGIVTVPIEDRGRFYINELCLASKDGFSSEAIPHLISLLFIDMFSHFDKHAPKVVSAPSDTYITRIDCYISNNLDRAITLDDMANELHVCSRQVSRIIKKEYGCTLVELINRRRMGVAAMLLINTGLRTQEIALSVGYASEKNFRNNFKKQYGVTPTEYREQRKKS